jgi:myb proto-oncogene protein
VDGVPAFKKLKWSVDEDEPLKKSAGRHGLANWTGVTQCIPGRNGKQCREQWMNQLCPALSKDA